MKLSPRHEFEEDPSKVSFNPRYYVKFIIYVDKACQNHVCSQQNPFFNLEYNTYQNKPKPECSHSVLNSRRNRNPMGYHFF